MVTGTKNIQNKILQEALKDIAFDGLNWNTILRAAEKSGYDADVATSVFPDKVTSFLLYFSTWIDDAMLEKLKETDPETMKIRERVRHGVWVRLNTLEPHKEIIRLSLNYWMNPLRKPKAAKMVWKTADHIWKWAGDNAIDYNKYTKRALLTGVISATTLAWINDRSDNHEKTAAFLDRRIDNVLVVGKLAGKILNKVRS